MADLGDDRLRPEGRGKGESQRGYEGRQPPGGALSGAMARLSLPTSRPQILARGGQTQQERVEHEHRCRGKDGRGQVHAPGRRAHRQQREQLAHQDVERVTGGMRHRQLRDDDLELERVGLADGGQQRAQVERQRRQSQDGRRQPADSVPPRDQQRQHGPADEQRATGQRARDGTGDVEERKEEGRRTNDQCPMTNGEWRMENGEWRMGESDYHVAPEPLRRLNGGAQAKSVFVQRRLSDCGGCV
jgi:hypothetical protein